jgi:hypothetical protein
VTFTQNPAPTIPDVSLGFCQGFFHSENVILALETMHVYDTVADTVSQYSPPPPYNDLNNGINIDHAVYLPAVQRYLAASYDSNIMVTVGLDTSSTAYAKVTEGPVAFLARVGTNQVFVGFANTIDTRELLEVKAGSDVYTKVSSYPKLPNTRDMAGVYLQEPLNQPEQPLYIMLYDENQILIWNAPSGETVR